MHTAITKELTEVINIDNSITIKTFRERTKSTDTSKLSASTIEIALLHHGVLLNTLVFSRSEFAGDYEVVARAFADALIAVCEDPCRLDDIS